MKDIQQQINEVLDELSNPTDRQIAERAKREAEERKRFFAVLGIEDDGRRSAVMTREEFLAFSKGKVSKEENRLPQAFLKGKTGVYIYFEFEPYHDVSYTYYPEENCIVESRFYVGD